jgi:hypothetical protein
MNAQGHAAGGIAGNPGLVPATLGAELSGGGGAVSLHHASHLNVHIGSRRMVSQIHTEVLTYDRRNPANNLTLRTR